MLGGCGCCRSGTSRQRRCRFHWQLLKGGETVLPNAVERQAARTHRRPLEQIVICGWRRPPSPLPKRKGLQLQRQKAAATTATTICSNSSNDGASFSAPALPPVFQSLPLLLSPKDKHPHPLLCSHTHTQFNGKTPKHRLLVPLEESRPQTNPPDAHGWLDGEHLFKFRARLEGLGTWRDAFLTKGGYYLRPHPCVFTSACSLDVLASAELKSRKKLISNILQQPQRLKHDRWARCPTVEPTWCHSDPHFIGMFLQDLDVVVFFTVWEPEKRPLEWQHPLWLRHLFSNHLNASLSLLYILASRVAGSRAKKTKNKHHAERKYSAKRQMDVKVKHSWVKTEIYLLKGDGGHRNNNSTSSVSDWCVLAETGYPAAPVSARALLFFFFLGVGGLKSLRFLIHCSSDPCHHSTLRGWTEMEVMCAEYKSAHAVSSHGSIGDTSGVIRLGELGKALSAAGVSRRCKRVEFK